MNIHVWVFCVILIPGYESTPVLTHTHTDTHTHTHTHIYYHLQTDCFVVSQHFSVARQVGRLKLGSKPAQIYVRLSKRPLGQQAYHVWLGNYKVLCSNSSSGSSSRSAHLFTCTHHAYTHQIFIYLFIYIYIYVCMCVCVCVCVM